MFYSKVNICSNAEQKANFQVWSREPCGWNLNLEPLKTQTDLEKCSFSRNILLAAFGAKCSIPGYLNHRNLFLIFLEVRGLRSRYWQLWFFWDSSPWFIDGYLFPVPPQWFSLYVCTLTSFSCIKAPVIGLGPTHMNSSKGPVSKYSHILRHFELGKQNSADDKAKACLYY